MKNKIKMTSVLFLLAIGTVLYYTYNVCESTFSKTGVENERGSIKQ